MTWRQAEILDQPGPEVLEHDIARLNDDLSQSRKFLVTLEVDGDGAFVSVERLEIGRGTMPKRRPPMARVVTGLGTFDLDHLRAHLGKDPGPIGAGDAATDFEDANTVERKFLSHEAT